jgi:hypothetical protein
MLRHAVAAPAVLDKATQKAIPSSEEVKRQRKSDYNHRYSASLTGVQRATYNSRKRVRRAGRSEAQKAADSRICSDRLRASLARLGPEDLELRKIKKSAVQKARRDRQKATVKHQQTLTLQVAGYQRRKARKTRKVEELAQTQSLVTDCAGSSAAPDSEEVRRHETTATLDETYQVA